MRGTKRAGALVFALTVSIGLGACTSSSDEADSTTSASPSMSDTPRETLAPPSGSIATEPVPPPTPGNINETVAPAEVQTKAPVGLTDEAEYGGGVAAEITSVEAVTAEAKQPGEITGPAIRLTVEFTNDSGSPISVDGVLVDLVDSDGVPGGPILSGGEKQLAGEVAPGESASGQYLFTVPADRRSPVTVYITYAQGAPILAFQGNVS